MKRLFDILFSLFALLLLSPLYLVIACAIKLTSPGPIIFSQYRLGKEGALFKCYKFRTMYPNADQLLDDLLTTAPHLKREWHEKQKLAQDPRIFFVGSFLRKFSLDELPQFYNVIKGDLSIVGPRPYLPTQLNRLGPFAPQILSKKPGITGLWQTSGRSSTTFQERIHLDASYVRQHSFWIDLFLIVKTVKVVFHSKNAS